MAFVAKPTITVSYSFRDNDGKTSTFAVTIPGATAPADAVAFADALRPLAAALSDAVIVGQNVLIGSYEDAIPAIPRSDVEDKGLFQFNTANGLPVTLTIPSIIEGALQTNNQDIDQALAAVGAFVDAMTLGVATVQPVNASGGDLTTVKAAYKQNRRSHKSAGAGRKG